MARLPYVIPYDPDFLGDGFHVPMPVPRCRGRLFQQGRPLDYIHFSLVLHAARRTALFTAHNIDGNQLKSVPRTRWALDERAGQLQLSPSAYIASDIDRGHLVRRAAVAWGSVSQADAASDSTFFYTNAAPQLSGFNREEWLALEDWTMRKATRFSSRVCVFTGPAYSTNDTIRDGARVPWAFWKVVVLRDPEDNGNDLAVAAFVMVQDQHASFGGHAPDLGLYQVSLAELGQAVGLDFGPVLGLDDFAWRRPRFRDRHAGWLRLTPTALLEHELVGSRRRRRHGLRALPHGPRVQTADPMGSEDCSCAETTTDALRDVGLELQELKETVRVLLAADTDPGAGKEALRSRFERIVGGAPTEGFHHCVLIGNARPMVLLGRARRPSRCANGRTLLAARC